MLLYLIRHAHAVDDADDAARTLSRKGREQVRALAGLLGQTDVFTPVEVWHSPLVRARETAELFVAHLKLKAPLVETPGLKPEDAAGRIAQRVEQSEVAALALVGHEPHLSALASLLVMGAAEPPRFMFKKCAVLALEGVAPYWAVRWHVSPELIA